MLEARRPLLQERCNPFSAISKREAAVIQCVLNLQPRLQRRCFRCRASIGFVPRTDGRGDKVTCRDSLFSHANGGRWERRNGPRHLQSFLKHILLRSRGPIHNSKSLHLNRRGRRPG